MVRGAHVLLVAATIFAAGCARDAGADAVPVPPEPGDVLASVVGTELSDAIRRRVCDELCDRVEDLRAEWAQGRERVEADPELTDLASQWPACMAGNGFDVTRRSELDRLVLDRLEPEISDGEKPSAAQQASADRLQRRLDALDVACSVSYEQRLDQLMLVLETEFVEDHADALAEALAALPVPTGATDDG